jgi:FtsH-binding integral membrane protein
VTFYELLILGHVIGTVLGVGAATFAEIHYTRFNSDDIIDDDERKTLATTYTVMRVGLFLLVVTGFAFLLSFRFSEQVGILHGTTFWTKMIVVGILVANALLLQARMIPFAIGTAISLTSWYAALVIGVVGRIDASFVELFSYYVAAIVIVYFALRSIRRWVHRPQKI